MPLNEQSPQRARFEPAELARVLGCYDLGKVGSVVDYRRGQPTAPKAVIECARGKLLLKRRPPDRAEQERVESAHRVINRLIERGVPAAPLVKTKEDKTTVYDGGHAYELFVFIEARVDNRTPSDALASGRMLARVLGAMDDMVDEASPMMRHAGYHDSAIVRRELELAGDKTGLGPVLLDRYNELAREVRHHLPRHKGLVHGDWHPGNLLYRNGSVAGVVDFDGLRLGRGAEDVATGALQAGLRPVVDGSEISSGSGSGSVSSLRLDADRFLGFVRGYAEEGVFGEDERAVLPGLLQESVLAEAAGPVARTGHFGKLDGRKFLDGIRKSLEGLGMQAVRLLERVHPTSDR